MAREEPYNHPPGTVFQACINAVAYLNWAIESRDESRLTMEIRTPFTMSDYSPTFQDEIRVEVIDTGNRSRVWVDSNPRFQVWNWRKDRRNEENFIEEVSRELQRITAGPPADAGGADAPAGSDPPDPNAGGGPRPGQAPGGGGPPERPAARGNPPDAQGTTDLSAQVEAARRDGWAIEDETEHRVVMIDRSKGSRVGHLLVLVASVLLALVTGWLVLAFVGNLGYAYYNYIIDADRWILRAEESAATGAGPAAPDASGRATGAPSG